MSKNLAGGPTQNQGGTLNLSAKNKPHLDGVTSSQETEDS